MSAAPEGLVSALADRYAITREIGRGGMATVYLAEDVRHKRQVAIKVLRPELAAVTGAERFLREVEIAAQLEHPHILTLIDSGEANGFLYYVMPFVAGDSLRARVAAEGALPLEQAVRVFREIVDALSHAHTRGVVHRDIKPDNVLFSSGHAVVTDFGIAKAVSEATGSQDLTTAGMALGTPAYMAPEQAVADPNVDHRGDIYAAGVVAYEMLTGAPPFRGTTAQQVLAAHVSETPDPVEKRRDRVPPALATLIMRCLEKNPADRWQSAADLLRELDAATTPTMGTMPVAAATGARPLQRVFWGALAVVALAVAAVFLLRPAAEATTTDPDRLVVVPFTPAVPDTALARLGRELVVLLSTSLDGVGDLRTVLGSSVLAQAPDRDYTLEDGIALARSFGAGRAIHASLLREGELLRADAVIATVDGGEQRFTVTAPLANKAAIADSIGWAILRELWEEGTPPSPRIADRIGTQSLEALSAFLEGERAFVDARFNDAEAHYARAFEADSTFWLAYRQFARSRFWMFRSVPSEIVRAYQDHQDELPEQERLILEANALELPEEQARLATLMVRFPDYWPATFEYADNLVHTAPLRIGSSGADARAALERTLQMAPTLMPARQHLWWMTILAGDSTAALATIDTIEAMGGRALLQAALDYDQVREMRLITDARFRDTWDADQLDTLADQVARTRGNFGRFHEIASAWSGYYGAPRYQIAFNRAVARRTAMRDVADIYTVATAFAWAERGAWDSAMATIREATDRSIPRSHLNAYRLAVLGAWLGTLPQDAADEWRPGAEQEVSGFRDRLDLTWLDGILAAARRDVDGLAGAQRQMAADTGLFATNLARSLGAFLADVRGDRATATTELLGLVRDIQAIGNWSRLSPLVNPVHRLSLGRWLPQRGEHALADSLLRWYEGFYFTEADGWALIAAMPIMHLERARIMEAWGRPANARRFYEEFLRLYDEPDRRQAHLITEAEQALARLDGVSEGRP